MVRKLSLKRRTFKKSLSKRYKRTNRYKRTKKNTLKRRVSKKIRKNTLKRRVSKRNTLRRKSFRGGLPRADTPLAPIKLVDSIYGLGFYNQWTNKEFLGKIAKEKNADMKKELERIYEKWKVHWALDAKYGEGVMPNWTNNDFESAIAKEKNADMRKELERRYDSWADFWKRDFKSGFELWKANKAKADAEAARLAKQQAEAAAAEAEQRAERERPEADAAKAAQKAEAEAERLRLEAARLAEAEADADEGKRLAEEEALQGNSPLPPRTAPTAPQADEKQHRLRSLLNITEESIPRGKIEDKLYINYVFFPERSTAWDMKGKHYIKVIIEVYIKHESKTYKILFPYTTTISNIIDHQKCGFFSRGEYPNAGKCRQDRINSFTGLAINDKKGIALELANKLLNKYLYNK